MKKYYFSTIIVLFIFSSCLKDGQNTIILPEHTDTFLPEEIATTWNAAIKCKTETEVAIELNLTTQSDTENFIATGSGQDYDGSPVEVTISGTYHKEFNILSAEVKYTFANSTFRIDHFAVDLNFYEAGSYLDMIKIDESYPGGYEQSCDTQIKLFY
jgi:hypothetical protein